MIRIFMYILKLFFYMSTHAPKHVCSYGVKINERKKSEELGELLWLEPVNLIMKKCRLIWFGHIEWKDDIDRW